MGERGCTFSPAVYNGKRRKENYMGQKMISLDFDNGVTFAEIRRRAEHYRLPILFAYKTFSYTGEHEKFRVVFALNDVITDSFTSEAAIAMFMKIFKECDEVCRDSSRMFFGGIGLLELADEPIEISGQDMLIAFVTYMNDRYGANHYTREMAAGVNAEQYDMRPMRVEFNGYDFQINTFDNERLQMIQLWMLESLLEQAVGRARLLRYNCTVKVFARFPIDQAIIE